MIARKSRKGARKPRLTPAEMAKREKAIIDDIKAGVLSYREIALKQGVSLPTVNNKARKAGISRGRRKGAKIIVAPLRSGPKPKGKKKAARKATRKAGRKPARKVARRTMKKAVRKAARRPVKRIARRGPGRPKALPIMSDQAVAPVVRRRRRRKVARRAAPATSRARGNFLEALSEVVLKYYPGISHLKFEKLRKTVEAAAL
jgi:DNA-binding CsgD family transcriptional regulator